ncbi:MAG: DUF4405 domain-containing protein [Bacteroidetes bacterium]|nr:DUF4405 domain-containing protein [Bacteroidota bacterium]
MIQQSKYWIGFLANNFLLLSGFAMVISGLALQIGFHIGSSPGNHERRIYTHTVNVEPDREINPGKTIWGVDYKQWTMTHKTAIVSFSLFMLYHFVIHWKWYKGVITKHLIGKNKSVIILSLFFIMVAFTGITSWIIDLLGNKSTIRMDFMEIH